MPEPTSNNVAGSGTAFTVAGPGSWVVSTTQSGIPSTIGQSEDTSLAYSIKRGLVPAPIASKLRVASVPLPVAPETAPIRILTTSIPPVGGTISKDSPQNSVHGSGLSVHTPA